MTLWSLVDEAVAQTLSAHPDYFTAKGKESARKYIVRKVTAALRDSIAAPKAKSEEGEEKPDAQAQEPTSFNIECWSKDWWGLLFTKIARGQSIGWMMQFARTANKETAFVSAMKPAPEIVEQLKGYPSDGDAVAKWRPWLECRGARLPEWRQRFWIFLPSPDPPPKESENAA